MLLGAVLAGMMSIDFGGPFNKAAYVFGTASIASGQFDIMASVMIGGMVPPIAIALCHHIFLKTVSQRVNSSRQVSQTHYGTFFLSQKEPFHLRHLIRFESFRHVWLVLQ